MKWNIFSGSTGAGDGEVPAATTSASTPAAPAPTPENAPAGLSTEADQGTGAGPDAEDSERAAKALARFGRTLDQEIKYQEQQFPTYDEVPGCMRLFDEFLMCYALVPQLRNLYRHGELRDCTYKFEDFKYCMSMKSEDTEERRRLWIRRRAEWWAARRVGASSEDVWEARTEKLENFPPLYDEETGQPLPDQPAPAPASTSD